MRRWIAALVVVSALAGVAAAEDTLTRARELAFSGKEHRVEALQMCERLLAASPGNNDVRTFYGTVLSWEGRYDEARTQLTQVLTDHPYHSDALPALINVELWSDHPKEAERLAKDGVAHDPKNTALMLQLARAQRNEGHYDDSRKTLDQLLLVEPSNQDAQKMRRFNIHDSWGWEAAYTHTTDLLSHGRQSQQEDSFQVRGPTPIGSVIGRWSHAQRFGFQSDQFELDAYPHIRSGTYMYVNVGASPDRNLYPKYRLGFDVYQMVGHGFEVSAGYRRLYFGSGTNIYTWALSKYHGDWLVTGRMYITPDQLGVSNSVQIQARRFFGSEGTHDYLQFSFSTGSSLSQAQTLLDVLSLNTTRVTVEADKTMGRFALDGKVGISSEDQLFGPTLTRYTVQGSFYYRF
jgi:YaiO family outer membrane protein